MGTLPSTRFGCALVRLQAAGRSPQSMPTADRRRSGWSWARSCALGRFLDRVVGTTCAARRPPACAGTRGRSENRRGAGVPHPGCAATAMSEWSQWSCPATLSRRRGRLFARSIAWGRHPRSSRARPSLLVVLEQALLPGNRRIQRQSPLWSVPIAPRRGRPVPPSPRAPDLVTPSSPPDRSLRKAGAQGPSPFRHASCQEAVSAAM